MNSTSTGEALFQEILDNPDDDTIRRIYADWLDDEGQCDRAEFIRVQLDLSQIDELDPRRRQLERREQELLRQHREQWLGSVGYVKEILITFSRGFPASISSDVPAFLRHGEALVSSAPIERVSLTGLRGEALLTRLSACPHLARVRDLQLANNGLSAGDLISLFAGGTLPALRDLSLRKNPIGTDGVRVLLESPFAKRLRALDLSEAALSGTSIETLCRNEAFSSLEALSLDGNGLGTGSTQFLSAAKHLKSLRRLSLPNNHLTPTSARDLAQSPCLRNLTSLDLSRNPLGFDGAVELGRSPFLTNLEDLDLGHARLTPPALGHLSALASPVAHLSLAGNNLGTGGVEALLRWSSAPPLSSLDLGGNEIGDDGARALGGWKTLSGLRELALANNGIRAFGLRPLLYSPHMGPLRKLSLNGNRLGDMGGQVLARWPGLKGLHSLNLHNTGLGDVGASELLDALGEIENLTLTGCELSAGLVLQFAEAEMAGRIGFLDLDLSLPK